MDPASLSLLPAKGIRREAEKESRRASETLNREMNRVESKCGRETPKVVAGFEAPMSGWF
jgi:hypothetical protein